MLIFDAFAALMRADDADVIRRLPPPANGCWQHCCARCLLHDAADYAVFAVGTPLYTPPQTRCHMLSFAAADIC